MNKNEKHCENNTQCNLIKNDSELSISSVIIMLEMGSFFMQLMNNEK